MKLYVSGKHSAYELARRFDLAQSTIYGIVKRSGLIPRRYNRIDRRDDVEEVTEDGFSIPDPYHIRHPMVRRLMAERVIPIHRRFWVRTIKETERKGRHQY